MSDLGFHEQLIFDYLLGALPQSEAERLDELSFTDDQFAERLQSAEKDLVDAYVRNELSPQQVELFHKNYLVTPRRKEMVAIAELLVKYVDGSKLQAPHHRRRILEWGLAAAAVLLFFASVYLLIENSRLQKQLATRGKDTQLIHVVTFNLEPQMRGNSQVVELNLPPDCNFVRFNLSLEPNTFNRYEATLKNPDDHSVLWKSDVIQPRSSARALQVTIPAKLFYTKYYVLEVSGISETKSPEPVASYPFHITK